MSDRSPQPANETVVDLGPRSGGHVLALPWCDDAPEAEVTYRGLAQEPLTRRFRLATHRVDRWRIIPLPGSGDVPLVLSSTNPAVAKARILSTAPVLTGTVHGVVLPFGDTFSVVDLAASDAGAALALSCNLLGDGQRLDLVRLRSLDGLNWELDGVDFDQIEPHDVVGAPLASRPTRDGSLVCLLGLPLNRREESLRVWERQVDLAASNDIEFPLRFRVVPGTWPQIRLAAPDGTSNDVTATAHEVQFCCDPGVDGAIVLDVRGVRLSFKGRTATVGDEVFDVPGSGPVRIRIHLHGEYAGVSIDNLPPKLLAVEPSASASASAVTGNTADFTVSSGHAWAGRLHKSGGVQLLKGVVYGLREPCSTSYRTAVAEIDGPGELFYSSSRFAVYDRTVVESSPWDLPAVVSDPDAIVSPIRVVEEFAWRNNPFGDMTRVVDRGEVWRSRVEPGRFPELRTRFRSVDAAFALAMETFQRNSSGEFSLPGESNLWSAGYFQGSGLGFGSWRRDTAHVALRCGNLLDPAAARASLAHVVNAGFDNGADGASLPAVAVWDYVLATGDESLALETWSSLVAHASSLDRRFQESRGLVSAAQATSNDCFEEPENGGFALSTEVYSMQTYAAMSRLATLPGIADSRRQTWAARATRMRTAILDQYWNPERGYFTSGPVGSDSHTKGYWETSGAEAALWGFLGSRAESMVASTLRALRSTAMSEYGTVLFPYKEAENHFCASVWYCWQAGIARAAARHGDAALVHQLIGQQVRTVVRNKTFYEVTDAATGVSWRWPGQLWHAAGFASLILYGVLGIGYGSDGMTFTPAVSAPFDGALVRHLRYREATFDVKIDGHGARCQLFVDGMAADRIPVTATGAHSVVLAMH